MNEQARSLIKRVRETVPDPTQRALASDLLQMAIMAIEQFTVLDETIYAYFSDEGISLSDRDELSLGLTEVMFTEVHTKTFRAVRRLSSYLRAKRLLGDSERPAASSNGEAFDFGDDFDLAFEDTGVREISALQDLSIDDLEIDKAFEAIADDDAPDSTTMYAAFHDQVATLGRLLVQEADTFDQRIRTAIDGHNFELALRELDGSRQSLGEGLFALISSVFEVFGVHIERSDIVPSYKNALEQSLLLRKGLAELSQVVTSENDWVIKDDSMAEADVKEAIGRVADVLEGFVDSELCRAMRAPDRLELEAFLRKIRTGSTIAASLACEGLAKYLESLSIINQREVLVEHDKQVMNDIRQSLEAARSLLLVSPGASVQLVRESLQQADKLRGRNSRLDEQLDQWSEDSGLLGDAGDVERVIDILDALIR
jgi:hypothetical protein